MSEASSLGIRAVANWISRAVNYVREVVAELKRVVWPSKEEVGALSAVVVFFVLILIAYIALLDFIYSRLAHALKLFR